MDRFETYPYIFFCIVALDLQCVTNLTINKLKLFRNAISCHNSI